MNQDALVNIRGQCIYTARIPLVSVIVVNHNYGRFIRESIDSITTQDYPYIEVLIVDNASTDDSREIIREVIEGDTRCTAHFKERNDGPLGAFLEGLERTSGEFVISVDADDFWFPKFVSRHVQTHLAVPSPVGMTSSGVVEINANGTLLSGGRRHGMALKGKSGLLPAGVPPRLPMIDDAEYEALDRVCVSLAGTSQWSWYPGAVHTYRRSVLNACRNMFERPELRTINADGAFMSIDGLLTFLCHSLAGSAYIKQPMSAYRLHGENLSNRNLSYDGFSGERGPAFQLLAWRREIMLDALLETTPTLAKRMSSSRYLQILSHTIRRNIERGNDLSPLKKHAPLLFEIFEPRLVMDKLQEALGISGLWTIMCETFGNELPDQSYLLEKVGANVRSFSHLHQAIPLMVDTIGLRETTNLLEEHIGLRQTHQLFRQAFGADYPGKWRLRRRLAKKRVRRLLGRK